jgi:purine-binding chemotaxis protein CheW
MISLRGHLLPLIALRVLLGLDADGFDRQKARIVVTRLGKTSIGLIVDKVTAIERVSTDDVDPVPPVLTRGKGEAQIEAICRLGEGRLISVLSPARLFEREAAARIIAAAEQGGTTMSASQTQTEAVERFVIFRLGEEYYGLPIAAVDEIVRRPDHLTRVPRAPDYVEGVMNLRGKVVPVIDQRMRFVVPGTGAARNRRVVVVTIDALQAGFVVDSVSEILAVPVGALKPAPELAADGTQVFDRIATIERDGRMILLVDPKVLLDQAERDLLAALTDGAATMHAP